MPTAAPAFSELINYAARLDHRAFEHFLTNVYATRARAVARPLERAEADLLRKINLGFPPEKWERLDFLDAKMEASGLAETEHHELLALIEEYEQYALRRLKLLGKLAELRGTSLRDVMRQLGIKHEADA